ncbi:uncharacterized protein J3D65DRAFT_684755 [Phyllosticta citribraziliensis]|uniref:BTB domain-containing protein n=1 Tax=Phyllosticta citribraziliensis TaxID=989973 RepID=A0ABR1LFA8_9PEZI
MPPEKKDAESELVQLEQFPKSNFQLKKHTDLTIICQGKKFHAHKLILSMKSGFFQKVLDADRQFGNFKMSIVNLDKDVPELVQRMLEFCYTEKFDEYPGPPLVPHHWNIANKKMHLYIELYTVAHEYNIEALKEAILEKARQTLGILSNQRPTTNAKISPLSAASIARKVFKDRCSDDGMRLLVLCEIMKNIDDLMLDLQFRDTIDQINGFWKNLTHLGAVVRTAAICCPLCTKTSTRNGCMAEELRPKAERQCKHCGKISPFDVWLANSNEIPYLVVDPPSDDEEESTTIMTPSTEYSIVSR